MNLSPSGANNSVVSDTEITDYVNEGLSDMLDIIITQDGDHYRTSTTILTDSRSAYPLPSDFYQLRGVDMLTGGGDAITLMPYNFQERNAYRNAYYHTTGYYQYRLTGAAYPSGQEIELIPQPNQGQSITVHYVPAITNLSQTGADGYESHFNFYNGWEEYVIVYAAIECLAKEESDTVRLDRRLERLKQRIITGSQRRDAAFPSTALDVKNLRTGWGGGFGGGNQW